MEAVPDGSGLHAKLDELTPEALVRSCHDILGAVSVLAMNTEWMAAKLDGGAETQAVRDESRTCVKQIAELTRAIQGAAQRAWRKTAG